MKYLSLSTVLAALLMPNHLAAQSVRSFDADDIAGKVKSANGPEAGVWVIAETAELPTNYIKIVVTDEQGRYVPPDLPSAEYKNWVRGLRLAGFRTPWSPSRGTP